MNSEVAALSAFPEMFETFKKMIGYPGDSRIITLYAYNEFPFIIAFDQMYAQKPNMKNKN